MNKFIIIGQRFSLEGEALRQLERASNLPGIVRAVGLPDLHPGKGYPVGAAFFSEGMIYPYLLGNDVGCGMGLWKTPLRRSRTRAEKLAKKLHGLEDSWDGDTTAWLKTFCAVWLSARTRTCSMRKPPWPIKIFPKSCLKWSRPVW